MNKHILILIFIFGLSVQFIAAQNTGRIQRGQRGYVPEPKYSTTTYIELKDPQEVVEVILPKCIEAFNLDDFQQAIFKNLLIKKVEDENTILHDKKNTRETRKKKIVDRNNLFFTELASIFTQEQVDTYKIMDFTETKEEIKEKKKKKRKNKKTKS